MIHTFRRREMTDHSRGGRRGCDKHVPVGGMDGHCEEHSKEGRKRVNKKGQDHGW